jgi:hypothetical protein
VKASFLAVLAMFAAGYTLLAFQLDPFGPAGSPGPGFLPRVLGIALLLALLPDALAMLRARGADGTGETGTGSGDTGAPEGRVRDAGARSASARDPGATGAGGPDTGAPAGGQASREPEPISVAPPHGRIAVAVGVLALLLVGSLPIVGTVPASVLFLFVALGLLNPDAHLWNAVLSVAVPVALYLVFTVWLGVQLPAGVFAGWL